ncbi:hypothetical protein [uncultured Gimesia sp.]|uniref:hypothetical protein n=1 Tax=uncultured Gimesia sp. TaxID=1678688 RepID=UPI0030D9F15E|tara:strand:- start:91518 stop:92174 length:657 start_codon:yes stop_codon:yes gene_type:complete
MSFFLDLRFSGILYAILILTTPAFATEPKEKGALPEIVPETPGSKKMPPLEEVLTITQNYFTGWEGYQSGDYITRNQIKPLFRQLQKAGWTVKAEKNILKRIHAETDYLSRQLSTPKGIKFMRRVSRMPGGYDRLDHLLAMPYGKRNIRDFINSPGGFTMIEYMTTTKGGKNLGKYLSQAKTGKGFNKPTSYIYTETELIQAIKQAYETETGQKKKKK